MPKYKAFVCQVLYGNHSPEGIDGGERWAGGLKNFGARVFPLGLMRDCASVVRVLPSPNREAIMKGAILIDVSHSHWGEPFSLMGAILIMKGAIMNRFTEYRFSLM